MVTNFYYMVVVVRYYYLHMDLLKFLPSIPFLNQKKSPDEFYFGLYIEEGVVEGCVWGIVGKHLRLISSARANYKTNHDLVEASNHVLDVALADFSPEPAKVLFGVPDSWLQDDNLKEENLKLLRHLVKALDVTPMAYVSTTHAVSHLLEKRSGVPTTAVLIGVFDPLAVTIVKAGKIIGTKYQNRSSDLADDIAKALMSFSDVEVLPSKITVYGNENLEGFKDKLTAYSWIPKLPFLHLPKVEILDQDSALNAVCLAGATELYPDVAFSAKSLNPVDARSSQSGIIKPEPDVIHARGSHHGDDEELENVGFVAGDVEELGGLDETYPRAVDEESVVLRGRDQEVDPYSGGHHLAKSSGILGMIGGFFAKVPLPRKFLSFGPGITSKLPLLLPVLVVLILVGAYIFLPKAQVAILIDPKILEKEAQITADPKVTSVDENAKIIPGKLIETDESGTDKAPATGRKQIGDPAKGGVIVYNLSSNKVSLPQGTVLTGPNNTKFTLDGSVSIASQSSTIGADFTTVTTPGKANSGVTAQTIGPDGNLPAATKLNVAGYTDSAVVAKVDSALSGGTSKDVQVVTSDDQKKLLASLASTLRQKAQADLQGKVPEGQKILTEALAETLGSPSYSKKVGEQASEFGLTLTVHYKGTTYADSDLKNIVSKLVEVNVPSGFDFNLAEAETQADVGKLEKDGRLIFNAKFQAKLIPKMDLEKIKKDLANKSPMAAADYLKNMENVVGSEIHIKPSLPGPLQRLPILAKNISVEIKPK